MPLVQTRGAASAQGFGEFAQAAPAVNYIDDVFSTYLYTGNGSTQTITNGIDLAGKGGLVWVKRRDLASHYLATTVGGTSNYLNSNTTNDYETAVTTRITSFNVDGFSLGSAGSVNNSGTAICSWTFREQAKFFDVVTYTGDGTNRTIAHNLGAVPGMIIVKRTDTTANWAVYHRSLANTQYLVLNSTAAAATGATWWNSTTPTSSVFSLGTDASINASGGTYVAYIYAHDAGGFGTAGTDNVISCGSFTADGGGNATINLGYEPQLVLIKQTNSANDWQMLDVMRGLSQTSTRTLYPNSSSAEVDFGIYCVPTATGFTFPATLSAGASFIYMAIRRPMKPPTSGTQVFNTIARTGTGSTVAVTGVGFPPDMALIQRRNGAGDSGLYDRLRGANTLLYPQYTLQESSVTSYLNSFNQDGVTLGTNTPNTSGHTFANWFFKRATGFFDIVCYTGTGTYGSKNHNLGVVPELLIGKTRSASGNWYVWSPLLNTPSVPDTGYLNSSAAFFNYWGGGTIATSTTFEPYDDVSATTYVTYLFASVAGVSKVGSYTGTAATQTINCGFTAGARFVLIKRTDSTGDWYVWDTARGIISGDDPYLLLNSTAAEVTNTDYIDPANSGFEISSTAPAAINANGGSFIFMAIA